MDWRNLWLLLIVGGLLGLSTVLAKLAAGWALRPCRSWGGRSRRRRLRCSRSACCGATPFPSTPTRCAIRDVGHPDDGRAQPVALRRRAARGGRVRRPVGGVPAAVHLSWRAGAADGAFLAAARRRCHHRPGRSLLAGLVEARRTRRSAAMDCGGAGRSAAARGGQHLSHARLAARRAGRCAGTGDAGGRRRAAAGGRRRGRRAPVGAVGGRRAMAASGAGGDLHRANIFSTSPCSAGVARSCSA